MSSEDKNLDRDDLFLLMESYRNMIQMNATLAAQQKQIMELQNKIIDNQEKIVAANICSDNKLSEMKSDIEDYRDVLTIKINENISSASSKSEKNFDETKKDLTGLKIDSGKHYSKLSMKIYIAMVGSITIIASIIGLYINALDKNKLLTQIYELLLKISNNP